MYLIIKDGEIVVEAITTEEEKELRKLAEDRVPLDVVKAEVVTFGFGPDGSPTTA